MNPLFRLSKDFAREVILINKNTFKIIGIALVIITILLAFWFSSKPGDVSIGQSDRILLELNLVSQYDIDAETPKYFRRRFLLRKGAHIVIYMIIGIGTTLTVTDQPKKVLTIVLLLAAFDEFIQVFTGRGASVSDISIDLVGGAIGWFVAKFLKDNVKTFKT